MLKHLWKNVTSGGNVLAPPSPVSSMGPQDSSFLPTQASGPMTTFTVCCKIPVTSCFIEQQIFSLKGRFLIHTHDWQGPWALARTPDQRTDLATPGSGRNEGKSVTELCRFHPQAEAQRSGLAIFRGPALLVKSEK